ncbi:PREDICTED: putative ammonium transporter 3 [Branchiostoma belcheri]|uniref:Ammonium transporter n=1 Tax=Branchiostoma belcheri TaxID=7741 RepID=A0A6P5ABN0_BRABE|nr:PREDICTED: putative ammonium transporter 3 [Branchiostoma belcheri]
MFNNSTTLSNTSVSTSPLLTATVPQEAAEGSDGFVHIDSDDATWILTSAIFIFTMQSGFSLLESGQVSTKNEVNIIFKNAMDVIFGGLTYWLVGYGMGFGTEPGSNSVVGVGYFFLDASERDMGFLFSSFFFQLAFATTSATIVSGAMAERATLESYVIFSLASAVIYALPSRWLWYKGGWLKQLGALDIAGSAVVHILGGTNGLVATLIMGPRIGVFKPDTKEPRMGYPTNALLGMFMLWWGWLGFNCGSTYGITGGKWKLSSRAAAATLLASMGGGTVGIVFSWLMRNGKIEIRYTLDGILGSLVSISALCSLARPWESLLIGAVGGYLAILGGELIRRLRIDDPVGVVAVHVVGGVWGMLAVGLFLRPDRVAGLTSHAGLIYGGGWYILGVQTLACVVIIALAVLTSFVTFKAIDVTIGLRISTVAEIIGADVCEHSINGEYDVSEGVIRTPGGETFQVPSGPVLSKKDVLKIIDISLALRNKVARSAYGKTVGLHGRRPSTANISDDGKSLVIRRARRAADDVTEEARELPQTAMTSHRPSGRHGRNNDAFDDAEGKFLKVPADVH